MSYHARLIPSLALFLLASCVGNTASPTLVLQLSQLSRALTTERALDRGREFSVSAAVSVSLEKIGPPILIEPSQLIAAPVAIDCESTDSVLCGWADAAEEAVWLATLQQPELRP